MNSSLGFHKLLVLDIKPDLEVSLEFTCFFFKLIFFTIFLEFYFVIFLLYVFYGISLRFMTREATDLKS
jgi:hypothetical protein